MREDGPEILSGWKNIATFLGKGVRTVQRYERLLGLPIRRPAAKPKGSVLATKRELEAWIAASPIREVFSLPAAGRTTPSRDGLILKDGLAEMRRLRQQMSELRRELKLALNTLHTRLQALDSDARSFNNKRPRVH